MCWVSLVRSEHQLREEETEDWPWQNQEGGAVGLFLVPFSHFSVASARKANAAPLSPRGMMAGPPCKAVQVTHCTISGGTIPLWKLSLSA